MPIPEVTAFLRHLHNIERSPNTVKGYAYDLAHFFGFLFVDGSSWQAVSNETLGRFIRFLRTPADRRRGTPGSGSGLSATSVNRALAAVSSFALFLHGTTNDTVYERLSRTAARSYRFEEAGFETRPRIGPRLRSHSVQHRVLEEREREAIIGACTNFRDRFFFSLLNETGMRVGQALLLRHSDVAVPTSSVLVRRHLDETSTERNKSLPPATVPVSPELIRLYAAYMHAEYGLIDSDYVFINLGGGEIGQPMTYKNVYRLVRRLRVATGIDGWSPHSFRHTYVTRLLSAGVPMETVSYLVTHSSVLTTINTYNHPDVTAIREQMRAAGVWAHV